MPSTQPRWVYSRLALERFTGRLPSSIPIFNQPSSFLASILERKALLTFSKGSDYFPSEGPAFLSLPTLSSSTHLLPFPQASKPLKSASTSLEEQLSTISFVASHRWKSRVFFQMIRLITQDRQNPTNPRHSLRNPIQTASEAIEHN
jgi:hypothetical protein